MKKIQIAILLIMIFSAVTIGCTAATLTPIAQFPSGFQTVAKEKADNLINGLRDQDYAIFSKDFDQKLTAAIPSTAMVEVHKLLWNQYGEFQKITTNRLFADKGYLIGYFDVIFEKGKISMQLVFNQTEPYQISGLWFPSN